MEDLAGRQIKGYRLLETIGTGGFGAVYRAEQPSVGREVAIKIILPQYANHPDFIRRFEVEAQVVARLEHPHIIPLYDYWRDPDGAYLVMRYLRGGSLRTRLESGTLSLEETGRILDSLAGALAVAHRQGVIHRDIKPDNILFDESDNAYLTDFGIAKDLSSEESVTQTNILVGSPAYLSPEQVQGQDVTPQSDIYVLGILIYEMLTGKHPFAGEAASSLLVKHLQEPVPSVRESRRGVPLGVEQVIQHATAKKPGERYSNVPTLAAAFRQSLLLGTSQTPRTHTRIALADQNITPTGNRTLLLDEVLARNPYKGLEAFEEADAANFFGREALIDRILSRLREQDAGEKFLAVIGPSGSGKSSVVQAGIIPRMRSGTLPGSSNWYIVEMLPGEHPLEELEAALLRIAVNPPSSLLAQLKEDERGLLRAVKRVLPDEKSELFLFIDQFEEIFTLPKDRNEISHFLNSIAEAVTDPGTLLRVIITLRADFYDRPLLYPAFGDLVRQHSEVVLPLTQEELERAIVGPANRVGIVLEPGLVSQIIADVREQPGALPLLQYALTELFERCEGLVMTFAAYQEIGGALGALVRAAETTYSSLNPNQQALARQVFLRMVALGESSIDSTRRRVTQAEVRSLANDADAINTVIQAFGASRLLTFDHDPQTRERTIEVAHEALIREWARLREWLEESRDAVMMHRRLQAATRDWNEAGRDNSYLAMGARLEQLEAWHKSADIVLNQAEAEYLAESIRQRETEALLEAERIAREATLEQRSRNQLQALVAAMTLAALIGLVLSVVAFTSQREAVANANAAATAQAVAETNRQAAERNAAQAELSAFIAATAQMVAETNRLEAEANAAVAARSAREARSLALAANARNLLAQDDPNLALALAIEAYRAFQPPLAEVQQTLALVAYGPNARFRLAGHAGSVTGVALSGERGVSISADGAFIVWDLRRGSPELRYWLPADAYSLDLSDDGKTALLGLYTGSVLLWDVDNRELIRELTGHTDVVTRAIFSPDETSILSVSLDRSLRLWDAATGEPRLQIETPGALLDVAVSATGMRAVTGSADLTMAGGHPPEEQDRTVRVWNLNNGNELHRFESDSGFVRTVDYSPDGQYVASGAWDTVEGGVVHLWNVRTGRMERSFFGGHSDVVTQVRFSPDSKRLISSSWDRSLVLWDVTTGVLLQRFEGHEDRVLSVDYSPDGEYVLVGTGNIGDNIPNPAITPGSPDVWLWDLAPSRMQMRVLDGHMDWVWAVGISPDGRLGASGSGPFQPAPENSSADTSIRLWDMTTGEEVRRLTGHTDTVHGLAFSPDGRRLASASWDGTVRIWNVETGIGRVAFSGHDDRVLSVMFSRDGQQALSASTDDTVRLWDVATGEEIRQFEGHETDVNAAVFSPDNQHVASASSDGLIRLYDTATGELIRTFNGHRGRVTGVVFSPDATQLLSTSWDTTVRLWDVATGEEIRQFVGHSQVSYSPTFSPDGQMALTGSADQTVRLWQVASGEQIRQFDGHTNWVLSTAFSPDGSFILTGAEDNTARQWLMARTPEELIVWARTNRYIPELTCAERSQYRIEPVCQSE